MSLFIVSCKKEVIETQTLSGLLPSKFTYHTEEGDTNRLYIMKNAKGMEVTVINWGARIVSAMVPDKAGKWQNVVVGYDSIEPYLKLNDYHGAVLGRYAGRIAGETILLDRVTYRLRLNDGKNMLNGGPRGFSAQYFTIEQPNDQSLICSYFSKEDEEGFPGNLQVTVTYTVTEENAIRIDYQAVSNPATFINLSNQSYFNLSGAAASTLEGHRLFVDASTYTPTRDDLIPTGAFAKVKGTPLDYTTLRPLNIKYNYDLNYVLNKPGKGDKMVAKAVSDSTGISMEVYTTEPGMQFYTDQSDPSFCMATQHFPDSPHQAKFPSTILRVDSTFKSQTVYKFGIE
ncbi:MAG: galactose mutarotase [Candidatus Azobacteroides sp.]|nr:galactose mutarotase [Candidatus Azobacteroides sp.]